MDIAASGGASLRPRDVLEINVVTKDQLDLEFGANFFVPRLVVAITEIREQYGIKSRERILMIQPSEFSLRYRYFPQIYYIIMTYYYLLYKIMSDDDK